MARVVVAGGSGRIGRALVRTLVDDSIEVDVLTRDPRRRRDQIPGAARVVAWDPADPASAVDAIRGSGAVVNVTGAPIGPLPWWLPGRRGEIVRSRVGSTSTLVAAIERLPTVDRPGVLVNASGTDIYTGLDAKPADEGTETAEVQGFLARLGRDWETAAMAAESLGVRVVTVRTAFVLAKGSPLLALFSLPTRLFLGGPIGGGRQWFSWIHLDDLVAVYRLAIDDERIHGPINAAAPNPVPQREVARAMGRALRRPAFFPVPAWPLRLVLGEQATLILGSRRVAPATLLGRGFTFQYPNLEPALRDALGRSPA